MITINTFKGVIFDPKPLIATRNIISRNGKMIDDIFLIGNRKPLNRRGLIFAETLIVQNDLNKNIKSPRQEPLEHSWKKLNM
ncbi:hypothetical protein P3K85_19975 [Bacillus cytotoxicus]